jgi:hypothetical protein
VATEEQVQENIEKAWELAETAQEAAEEYASDAQRAAAAFITSINYYANLNVPDTDENQDAILAKIRAETDVVLSNDLVNLKNSLFKDLRVKLEGLDTVFGEGFTFDAKDNLQVVDTLASAFNDAFTFGGSSGGLSTSINQLGEYLLTGIMGTDTEHKFGLPKVVEQQISDDMFDSIEKESIREENDAINVFAARGFPMPAGALTASIESIREKGFEEKAKAARDIAIKQGERAFDANFKYIEIFRDVQTKTQDYFLNYLNAIIKANESDFDEMKFLIDAIAKLRASMIDLYTYSNNERELLLKEAIAEEDFELRNKAIVYDAFNASVGNRVKAALASAEAMGKMAAAAVGSQNSMTSLAHETLSQGDV